MQIDFRRGFFRAWVLVALVWATGIAALSYGSVTNEFAKEAAIDRASMARIAAESILLVPVSCPGDGTMDVRGAEGTDYTRGPTNAPPLPPGFVLESQGFGPWDRYLCWYEMPTFRRLYPEYDHVADEPLTERLYARAGRPTAKPKPWTKLAEAMALALGPPAGLLILGGALGWVLSGFRRPI